MSFRMHSFAVRPAALASSFAFLVALTAPAIAHAEDDAAPQLKMPTAEVESPPSRLRWGIGLAGVVGAGYSISDPAPGAGGPGGGIVGELGSVLSESYSVYWAPQVYVLVDRTNRTDTPSHGIGVVVQNAAIFEWASSDHFAFGLGPSLDFAWWQNAAGEASPTFPMFGGELRAEVTFGPREGQPRVFMGANLHASTVLVAGWATASLAVGVHSF